MSEYDGDGEAAFKDALRAIRKGDGELASSRLREAAQSGIDITRRLQGLSEKDLGAPIRGAKYEKPDLESNLAKLGRGRTKIPQGSSSGVGHNILPADPRNAPFAGGAAVGGLPTGAAGDMLYHNGTDWVVVACPTVSAENPALRHDGTAPYWEEPEDC